MELSKLKKCVHVNDGERPLENVTDAITVAERAGILYRWAKNGGLYQLRWGVHYSAINVPTKAVCQVLYDRTLEVLGTEETEEVPPPETEEEILEEENSEEVEETEISEEEPDEEA